MRGSTVINREHFWMQNVGTFFFVLFLMSLQFVSIKLGNYGKHFGHLL